MLFNFKKNNILLILLLTLVIVSSLCYIMMQNNVEGFLQNSFYYEYFDKLGFDASFSYYTLKSNKKYLIESSTNLTTINDSSGINVVPPFTITSTSNFYKYTEDSSWSLYHFQQPLSSTTLIKLDLSSVPLSAPNDDTVNIMLLGDTSGNVYDLSKTKLNINLELDGQRMIQNGKLTGIGPVTESETSDATGVGVGVGTGGSGEGGEGGSVSIGDINFKSMLSGFGGVTPEKYAYMLENGLSTPTMLAGYKSPFYGNFESAMNMPSNPIVNPVNSMNPLQYSESLFGPNVTPMMVKSSYLNQNLNNGSKTEETEEKDSKDSEKNNSFNFNNLGFDSKGELLTQNSESETKSSKECNNITVDSDLLKEKCPPCPGPQRCPESNFECKKIPNYEQGNTNGFLPRAVLTDFSTFGM
jgi:hypothetical protein